MDDLYQLTDRADQDLFEASLYIARVGSTEAAEGFLRTVKAKFALLADNPGLGRRREDLATGLRSVPEGRYVIFYRLLEEGILVIRFLHGSRDANKAFGDPQPRPDEE